MKKHRNKVGDGLQPSQNQQIDEWKNKYLRALADYQNLEKRTEGQVADIYKRANKKIVLKLLDILDVLDQAEVFVTDNGLKLVKDEFEKLLASEGVKKMELVGTKYDPYLAEVVEMIAGDKPATVVEVVKNGYMLYDEVLRHAQVKVIE